MRLKITSLPVIFPCCYLQDPQPQSSRSPPAPEQEPYMGVGNVEFPLWTPWVSCIPRLNLNAQYCLQRMYLPRENWLLWEPSHGHAIFLHFRGGGREWKKWNSKTKQRNPFCLLVSLLLHCFVINAHSQLAWGPLSPAWAEVLFIHGSRGRESVTHSPFTVL